jgi:CRP-like cAMP-binding protein
MPCCIYLLVKGKVQLLLNGKDVIQFIEPDEIFGLTEAIANLPYEMNAETSSTCLCECIGREEFIRFLQTEPEVCFRLVQMLGLNLQKSYQLFISSIT